jgi:hypothetical protein
VRLRLLRLILDLGERILARGCWKLQGCEIKFELKLGKAASAPVMTTRESRDTTVFGQVGLHKLD